MAKTIIAEIRNSAFPAISIPPGTFVVWTNRDPFPHAVETLRDAEFYFNPGALQPGETSSPVFFDKAGSFPYLCRFHEGMDGIVTVVEGLADATVVSAAVDPHEGHQHGHGGHGGHGGLRHLHGFVTGGRSGNRLYMTHTPVIADPRHRFQIILQGSFIKPEHVAAYDAMRAANGGYDGRVQIFHSHISLLDIANGVVKELLEASVVYYPDRSHPDDGVSVPGLPDDATPVQVDRVIHFHTFKPDSDYPDGLAYLVYGDEEDIFIDHLITRAPNFHSVAKLKFKPDFWPTQNGDPVQIIVPSKRIRDVSPKTVQRVSFVDNAFHMYWLLPPGAGANQAQDPLLPRDKTPPVYDVVLEGGRRSQIEIGRFVHFDIRLLNYGVLIPGEN
ncbi:hypothetical protein V5F40_23135 [Xanthobacter sp. DSM 14520]|uniref:cupredoxin domain-containing protein n=1 Tax=Xanthobacter autotrophicus (strain ATCC BAA-1158 / Py2) TaxID=78245 RepID=UPI00372B2DDD